MPVDKFYIAPYDKNSGLINVVKPFMIPDKAFGACNNAYVWRNRARKRFGSRWLGSTQDLTRLRINIGTTAAVTGNFSATVPGTINKVGQLFSIGNTFFTVYQTGTPAAMKTTGTATGTYNTTSGAVVITGNNTNPLTAVYFYPAEPVMGLITYEQSTINDEMTIAFDTQFAYRYTTGWDRISAENLVGDAEWTGSNSQFFWGYTYGGASPSDYILYVTNFNENEPFYMRYLQNVAGTLTWFTFRPQISSTIFLNMARILVPFKNRLLAFNTWEQDGVSAQIHYPFRVRWSQEGDPTDQTNGWRQDIPGRGLGLDAPTSEAIITVEFIRDRLIVYFERSTWELVYQGNQIYPFAWQQINTEFGAESTFSVVPFDLVVLGVGNVGIMACTGTNVDRIDNSIPDEVFAIHNLDSGVERVCGIRDYYTEMVWWTFPDPSASALFPYPKRVLVYNYKNNTWAFNDDSITIFGYFQPASPGITWDSTTVTWDDEVLWDDGSLQAKFQTVIAGNQEGFTFLIDADVPINCSALQVTNLTVVNNVVTVTVIDFNMQDGNYIYFEGVTGTGNLSSLNGTIQRIEVDLSAPNVFTFVFDDGLGTILTGTYSGGGLIARVSKIEIDTKAYSFYQNSGRNAAINKIDFMVDRTSNGAVLVDWYVSTNINSMYLSSARVTGTGVLLGTSVLETSPYSTVPFEAESTQLWHSIYISAQGENIQLSLYMNDRQMRDPLVRESDFVLYSMIFSANPTSRLQ